MAQKRMIDKKISVSEQVANLSIEGQLLFTWMIPHADDLGALPYSIRSIKAMVVPMWDKTNEEIKEILESIVFQKLVTVFQCEGEKYLLLPKFLEHQTLKRDRQPQTILPVKFSKEPRDSWKTCEKILETVGIPLEDTGKHLDTEEKIREEKGREAKEEKSEEKPTLPADAGRSSNELPNHAETIQEKFARLKAYPKT